MSSTSPKRLSVVEPRPEEEQAADLSPRERLEVLCDPGSVQFLRSSVTSRRLGDKAQEGDGVVAASGTIFGRPIFGYAEDGRFAGGSLGEAHADTIVQCLQLANDAKVPVVGFIESAGARVQEGASALNGYARVFRENTALSGRVPQISIVSGTSAGGGCYSPALTDFVVMVREASMFLTGPQVVREVTGEAVTAEELGGARVHESNGVCQFVAPTSAGAATLVRDLLTYLPQNAWEQPGATEPREPIPDNPEGCVPPEHERVYDVREVASCVVDAGLFLEVAPKWARNIVTGFARIDGRAVGIVANQPRYLGGVLDVAAAQKAARFVRTCNCFNLPLVVLVDTPGFMPGTRQEEQGIIRHGAKLLHAFAEATVPKVTIILRQAYGGGYITMNSKDLGADFTYAWPRARIGIMGASQAVEIIHRREIASSDDPEEERSRLAQGYGQEHQLARATAREGGIDEVIDPAETRTRLSAALNALTAKFGSRGGAGNIPL
jgi:acetyl-CoA carboxylase carboxyltransferase component